MKRFKNKAAMQHYLLQPRELEGERKQNANGDTFRIYDDGNYITGHIFSIERLVTKEDGTEYWDRVSDLFTDWKAVSDKMNEIIND